MPRVAVASGDSLDAGVAMIDGEVECSSAVATPRIESGELSSGSGGGISGAMPEILIASGDGFDTRGALVDSEVECGSAVATLRIER